MKNILVTGATLLALIASPAFAQSTATLNSARDQSAKQLGNGFAKPIWCAGEYRFTCGGSEDQG